MVNQLTSRINVMSCLCVLGILLTACAPASDIPQPLPEVPSCTPSAPDPNVYRSTPPQNWEDVIMQYAATPVAPNQTPQDLQIQQAQYAALDQLTAQVKRWSSSDNIVLSTTKEIRITVTLISPALIQAVYLNQVLYSRQFYANSNELARQALEKVAERDELLFLVTITETNYDEASVGNNSTTLNIPLTQMILINASNLSVAPDHDDHSLNEQIRISQGPVSGYIAYPFTVQSGNECALVFDARFNTSITISVPHVLVNGLDQGQQTWAIQQAPLIDVGIPPNVPSFIVPQGFDLTRISPTGTPPPPVFNKPQSDTNYWNNYWQDMARYIWEKITLAELP
jgi:hypothetical protein